MWTFTKKNIFNRPLLFEIKSIENILALPNFNFSRLWTMELQNCGHVSWDTLVARENVYTALE